MTETLLSTKFYIPPTRLKFVSRPRLLERLNEGLGRKLTLISAPAGFGKTTLPNFRSLRDFGSFRRAPRGPRALAGGRQTPLAASLPESGFSGTPSSSCSS